MWQRLKNIWAWGALDPYKYLTFQQPVHHAQALQALTASLDSDTKFVEDSMSLIKENLKMSQATIIPYKQRDPIQEFVGDETAI